MQKAKMKPASGLTITIEGSPEEIQDVVRRLEPESAKTDRRGRQGTKVDKSSERAIGDYVLELREAGFFKNPRGLADIRDALRAEGHIIPITTLSGVMLRLVKARELRRQRDGRVWKYVVR